VAPIGVYEERLVDEFPKAIGTIGRTDVDSSVNAKKVIKNREDKKFRSQAVPLRITYLTI